MGIINQLDISIANLIAAGEVVDRPASVIKELMENSIDAGATEITVEIKNGGVSFMRVTDNGCGMSQDDAVLCLSRHATSKISSAADLDAIMTLGFRGEALAAIASVSKTRIMTRKDGSEVGTLVISEAGVITEVSDAGCKKGTTIIVEQLFANIPARRKFLKNDRTEGMAVAAVIEKIALSSPSIAIRFISDGVQKIMTGGDGKLYNTVYSIFGRNFAKKLIEVDGESEGISVKGYIGRPDNVRANRNFQNFFINSRYIKSRTASAALEQAFSSYIESEKFPCCILFIDIHPAFVDVNVHPTKLEIKFSNERAVFEAVYCAVKNAVSNDSARNEILFERNSIPGKAYGVYNSFVPVYDRLEEKQGKNVQISLEETVKTEKNKGVDTVPYDDVQVKEITSSENHTPLQFFKGNPEDELSHCVNFEKAKNEYQGACLNSNDTSVFATHDPTPIKQSFVTTSDSEIKTSIANQSSIDLSPSKKNVEAQEIIKKEPESKTHSKIQYKYLGVVFNTYIIIEYEDKMMIIDKHAAHERIIFESMQSNREKSEKHMQLLLIPIRLEFSKDEIACLENFGEEVRSAGFEFEIDYALGAVSLLALPGGIDQNDAVDLFSDILSRLSSGTGSVGVSRGVYFEKSLYQASCKAAMKGGRLDGDEHMIYIVETLLNNPKIRYCPHGRPVMFELSQGTIEHKFKRT